MRALAFWEAFPGALHGNEAIRCLAVDPGMKLVRVTGSCILRFLCSQVAVALDRGHDGHAPGDMGSVRRAGRYMACALDADSARGKHRDGSGL